jgi:hypothetical protein
LRLSLGATLDEVGRKGYGLLTIRGVDWSIPRDSAAFGAYAANLEARRKRRADAERRCAAEGLRVSFLGAPAEWQLDLSAAHLSASADVARARTEISAGRKPDPARFDRLFLSLWVSDNESEGRVLCLGFLDDRLVFLGLLTELSPPRDVDAMRAALVKQHGAGINPFGAAVQARVWLDRTAGVLIEDRPAFGLLTWSSRTGRGALVKALGEAWAK